MTYEYLYSPEWLHEREVSGRWAALVVTIFALFSVFLILRYSSKSMEGGLRFHLLNITVWIWLADLGVFMGNRYYGIGPIKGGCLPGEGTRFLARRVDPNFVVNLNAVSHLNCRGYLNVFRLYTVLF
jgi:hypothetical protein